MTRDQADEWLRHYPPAPKSPHTRLLCLSYAGGAASMYQKWQQALPDLEVRALQLPARQDRLRDKAITRITDIVAILRDALAALDPLPVALYGHSFGALNAFELARQLEHDGVRLAALIVGGRRSPTTPVDVPVMSAMRDEDFIATLGKSYGVRIAVLDDPDLREMALPSLRADFQALEGYQFLPGAKVQAPVTVLTGMQDPQVTSAQAEAWRDVSAGPFEVARVDGGHFFVDSNREWVIDQVKRAIEASRRQRS